MSKMIILNGDGRRSLERDFKVTRQTVWAALNYKTDGGRAKVLRAAALQRGGVAVDLDGKSNVEPKCTISFEEAPGQMVYSFGERVKIVCNLTGLGDTFIAVDDEEVENFGVVPLSKLPVLQARAQSIVNELK